MEEILAAGSTLEESRDRPTGTLRLSLPWIAGPLLIEPMICSFSEAYPDVRLDIVFDDRFVDIAGEGFDAGVRIGELLEKDMIAQRLGDRLQTAVLASPGYLVKCGHPKTIADLSGHRCIAYRFATTRSIYAWEFRQYGRDVAFTPDPYLCANSMALSVEAAARGLGLAFATEQLAAQHLADGRLVKFWRNSAPASNHFTYIMRAGGSCPQSSKPLLILR